MWDIVSNLVYRTFYRASQMQIGHSIEFEFIEVSARFQLLFRTHRMRKGMKVPQIIFVFVYLSVVYCDEFLSIWAPKFASHGKNYTITYFSRNAHSDDKTTFKFRSEAIEVDLKNEYFQEITFKNDKRFGSSKSFKFEVIVEGRRDGQRLTKSCYVHAIREKLYKFIQTDKPVYKPGDEVKFRILVVDKDLMPYHMNNIMVNIIDPMNRTMRTYDDLENQDIGVFENRFSLAKSTILGNWRIQVVVEGKNKFATAKTFSVSEYILPLFEVYIDTAEKKILRSSNVTINFHGKYSFGKLVTGHADLMIKNVENGIIYFTERFENVSDEKSVTYNIINDLKLEESDLLELEAFVKFTETESGISFNKSTNFKVYGNESLEIIAIHPQTFTPESEFLMKIFIQNWKGEKVTSHPKKIKLTYTYRFDQNYVRSIANFVKLENGYASYDIMMPEDLLELDVKAEFLDCKKYEAKIKMGINQNELEGLIISHAPENPKVNDSIEINIKAVIRLSNILIMIITKHGIVKTKTISCHDKFVCKFKETVSQEMAPHSTMTAIHVSSMNHIYKGSTKIITEDMTGLNLDISMSKTKSKTKEKLEIKFKGPTTSRVYLLAFDKRLSFINGGNDITKNNVVAKVSEYEDQLENLIIDLAGQSHKPTQSVYQFKTVAFSGALDVDMRFGMSEEDEYEKEENEYMEEELVMEAVDESVQVIRENFPETWIFETMEIGDTQEIVKEFEIPDSITTWMVSAFAAKKGLGIAIAKPQELIVMNDFFIKMNLPYSIRFKEILKLDILVYNYVEDEEELETTVKIDNSNDEIQFVEYKENRDACKVIVNNMKSQSKVVKIPHTEVKKVSFYIRSNSERSDRKVLEEIQLFVKATGNGRQIYQDNVKMKLVVEPVSVKTYSVFSQDYKLNGATSEVRKTKIVSESSNSQISATNVIIQGDYLSNSMDLESRFEIYPYHCLEQRTSLLKGNVEYFRYMLATQGKPSTEHFSDYYQSLLRERLNNWSYGASSGYRAYFIEAIASAMEIGALPVDKAIITAELDVLESKQLSTGEFSDFGSFPSLHDPKQSNTAAYFQTSFVLIPFIKFRKFIDQNYDQVSKKAFNFLESINNSAGNEGLSIAAYAFALYGDHTKAKTCLDYIEQEFIDFGDNKRCFKLEQSDESCDLRHTAYTALAFIHLNQISKAEPLVKWLLRTFSVNFFNSNTYEYAVATEPIAKLASYLKTDKTDISVELRNEFNFQTIVNIIKENSSNLQDVKFPPQSTEVSSTASGYGYCSITTIFEILVFIPILSSQFTVNITANESDNQEKSIEVCAEYKSNSNVPLINVIYEVEMPSGFVYSRIGDIENKRKDIKLIEEKRGGTLIFLYYDNFKTSTSYCVEVKMVKTFDVIELKDAGVKVYDYNDKENVAISFYKFPATVCDETIMEPERNIEKPGFLKKFWKFFF